MHVNYIFEVIKKGKNMDIIGKEDILNIDDCEFSKTTINNTDMENAVITDVNMKNSKFEDIDFSGTKINNVSLNNVEITDCDLEGMTIDGIDIMEMYEFYQENKK
ncbi:MAG: hypothetical protein CR982_05910 [Candidatus Cloacimonadota bacterium]|nr:MAG: hypothetical protein CR982_05910 [Candidatus Cloacimonadota bacterium]PIE78055.1 MAG: hypothetical protein CSA15_09470 [Candidatus Delongbacteria bacterium]